MATRMTPQRRGQLASAKMGRPSIFRHKMNGRYVQGYITKFGAERFDVARKRLAQLAQRKVGQVSDADVIEFLARGEADTITYLAEHS